MRKAVTLQQVADAAGAPDHRRIAFIHGGHTIGQSTERQNGYLDALAAAGLLDLDHPPARSLPPTTAWR